MVISETVIDRLKLVAAALFVMIGVGGVALSLSLLHHYPDWLIRAILVVSLLVFIVIALVLFNASSVGKPLDKDRVRKLESEGLIVSTAFLARRAFQVEEFEDEGSHYFLELDDRRVLFLSGQYLWRYDAEDQPRSFPCTEFVVRRHATKGYALDVLCGGTIIEPEVVAPPFDVHDFGTNAPRGTPKTGHTWTPENRPTR